MSQLTIKLSDKADALIAQLQKEIFNRRRKKVSAAGVVETLVESGAKSQSDKRFATSWTNLIADIEKAAKAAHAHGSKPANLTDAEWALILSHRSRAAISKPAAKTPAAKTSTRKPAAPKKPVAKTSSRKPVSKRAVKGTAVKATSATKAAARTPVRKKAQPATKGAGGSVAKRMAKAVSRLSASPSAPLVSGASANGALAPAVMS